MRDVVVYLLYWLNKLSNKKLVSDLGIQHFGKNVPTGKWYDNTRGSFGHSRLCKQHNTLVSVEKQSPCVLEKNISTNLLSLEF